MECIVAGMIERREMPAPENLSMGLWASKMDEINPSEAGNHKKPALRWWRDVLISRPTEAIP